MGAAYVKFERLQAVTINVSRITAFKESDSTKEELRVGSVRTLSNGAASLIVTWASIVERQPSARRSMLRITATHPWLPTTHRGYELLGSLPIRQSDCKMFTLRVVNSRQGNGRVRGTPAVGKEAVEP